MMKALVCKQFGGVEDVELATVPEPTLADPHAVTI